MKNLLIEYFFFILKIITIAVSLIIIIILTKKNENLIKITNLNKKYLKLRSTLYLELYSKNKRKKLNKNIQNTYNETKKQTKKNLLILNFTGDINASDTKNLKDIISLIILEKENILEVLLKLTSSGGTVNNYGLAAMQLKRLTQENITLTIAIDTIAASGGYMMACTAQKIIAANFAVIGSIGVIGIVPNINKLLNNNNIEIEYHTSCAYKRTLNIIGKNSTDGRQKFIEHLETTHKLFKNFVKTNRPQVNLDKISTGEYWYGEEALHLKLIDKIQTSDEYIIEKINDTNIYEISLNEKQNIKAKILDQIKSLIIK